MTMQQYCLRWNNHQPNFISVFSSLLNSESLVDVTLAAEGKHLQAHKVVLSACSSYFQQLFTINPCQHPIVILKDVKFIDLKVMVDFMYYGEVNVSQDQLPCILKTAEMLKIKGLAEIPVDQSIKQSSVNDKAELLTPGDSNWSSSEGVQRKSLSPSPCPLSPTARRKRLRKLSNGSNSGSGERTSEDQPTEILLSTSTGSLLGTVIKTEQRSMESSPPKLKQHSSTESDLVRGSSFESTEGETHHSITLQVPQQQDINTTQSIETTSLEVPGPSTSVSQQSMSGLQWNVMDQSGYAHFTTTSCSTQNTHPPPTNATTAQYVVASPNPNPNQSPPNCYQNQITNSPPQIMQKRKRSINPQADENFIRALDAVRFGGIGFCKAARMYGVNNRTLWLEYKKRGYPNQRQSIKNRLRPDNAQLESNEVMEEPMKEEGEQIICNTSHSMSVLPNPYYDAKNVVLPRQKYLEAPMINAQNIQFQGMSFEQV
ncbi:unnamed protein product [Brassicogethes aeneus]|uniref:BTB domain-containing protein n=1 Tax=Brassicogethes aeneus TaxID=1431903 RepID=A0A9P0ASL8_BRAAE|nr:unnamed protein product [Brassicogethes aeneus]